MAVLQHELQHVLDYATGWLNGLKYLSNPRHWRYGYRLTPSSRWDALGAEQRAAIAERIWLAERGLAPVQELADLRRLAPWAG